MPRDPEQDRLVRPFGLGQIVVLNGAPRAGKSSIAEVIQGSFGGVWMNVGLEHFKAMTPEALQPGIGLRPGGEEPALEPLIAELYQVMYESIAAHSRRGINVVADTTHHDHYSKPLNIMSRCARILGGLPGLLVGVRCPIDEIMRRRIRTWGRGYANDGSVPEPVLRWQTDAHQPGIYDLDLDTSQHSPERCADMIATRLSSGVPATAMARLATGSPEPS